LLNPSRLKGFKPSSSTTPETTPFIRNFNTPVTAKMIVVFPEPEAPVRRATSPSPTSRLAPSITALPDPVLYLALNPLTLSIPTYSPENQVIDISTTRFIFY
jgi:hypothetical protein